ncbi:MAG TPA: energy transducer TonB, partial [Armatimonadota bacterium]|nr:energy transducer TonB [Armatimonadota bacterium]
STFNAQLPKPVVQRSSSSVQHPATINHQPLTIDHSPSPQTPGTIEVAGSRESFTSSEGGTSATGPGAFVGEGSGGGITGSGEGRTVAPPDPTPNTQHPTPAPPPTTYNPQPTTPDPPKPKGESRAPSVAKQMKPIYPQDARDDGIEGTAVVLALIDPEGKVTDTRLEKSSGDRRLDRAAVDAVRKWTYNPCLKDGAPVKSSVRIRVEFRLE